MDNINTTGPLLISNETARVGQRVLPRDYVARALCVGAGTVTAIDTPGRWIEVGWDDTDIRIGMRPSHLKLDRG
jgi:hypothetical protein